MHGGIAHLRKHGPKWLSRAAFALILLLSFGLTSGEALHGWMLDFGERNWDAYYALTRNSFSEPSCQRGSDTVTIEELASGESAKSDQSSCEEEWERYRVIEQRRTLSLNLFGSLERGLAEIVTFFGQRMRMLWALLGLILMALSTFQRHHVSLKPIETRLEARVQAGSMVIVNGFLLFSSIAYQLQKMNRVAEGLSSPNPSFDWFWIVAFGGLTAASLVQLFQPSADLQVGGSPGKALLAIPVFGFLGLLLAVYAVNFGHYHGFNMLTGLAREWSGFVFGLVLVLWLHLWLVHKIVSR